MNGQFDKFVEQAEEWVCKNYPDAMDDNDEFHAQTMHKLGELIVRECAKFLDENSGYDNSNNAWHPEPEDLLKHFGVEE